MFGRTAESLSRCGRSQGTRTPASARFLRTHSCESASAGRRIHLPLAGANPASWAGAILQFVSTALVIVIVVVALALLAVAVLMALPRVRQRQVERRQEHERLERQVGGHRQEAETQSSRADQAARQAEAHRTAAEQHAARADELEDNAAQARRSAAFHDERRDETRRELEDG
jgi:biopolymer transport protein ExbB/TolQ